MHSEDRAERGDDDEKFLWEDAGRTDLNLTNRLESVVDDEPDIEALFR